MSVFPIDITPLLFGSYEQYHEYQAIVKRGVGKVRQARAQLASGVYSGRFKFVLSAGQLFDVERFLAEIGGRAVPFDWFSPDVARYHEVKDIGIGDGSTQAFLIPFGGEWYLSEAWMALDDVLMGDGEGKWEWGYEQQLRKVTDFSDGAVWEAIGTATVTRTGGQTDLNGNPTAWLIETSGGANIEKLQQTTSKIPAAGAEVYFDVWVKNVGDPMDPNYSHVYVMANGQTAGAVEADGEWHQVNIADTAGGTNPATATFAADSPTNNIKFHVWHPAMLFNRCDNWHFLPTDDTAIQPDAHGRLYVCFYPAAVPGAGVVIDVAQAKGRRYHYVALMNDPTPADPIGNSNYSLELNLEEVEGP